MKQVLDLQRVTVLVGLALLAHACGEKFTAGAPAAAGAGGEAGDGTGATAAAAAVGGEGATDGGVDAGGGAPLGGSGNGGRGGTSSVVGGSGGGGKANNGGSNVGGNGGSGGTVVEVRPVPVGGLELWFDANEGVTQTNGVVTSWKDRSGHKRDALQPSTTARPLLGKLNGKAALVFDGVDDHLRIDSLAGDFTKGVSIFVMMQQDVDAGVCTAFFEASNGPDQRDRFLQTHETIDDVHLGTWQSALLYEVGDTWVNPTDHPLVLGEPQLAAAVHHVDQAVELRRNSNTVLNTNFALPPTIPRKAFIGYTQYNGCKTLTGTIGEILVYSRAVSDAELIQVESYLNTKWDCCSE